MLVVLAPGQGAQSSGMLLPWLDLPAARQRLTQWSAAAGLDLLEAGTSWSDAQVRDTAVAQPLLTATALLTAEAVLPPALVPAAVCGHSVGELAALAVAGVLTPEQAVGLAARRGALMADAAGRSATGMLAVLGGDPDEVLAAAGDLAVATVNAPGQVVLGGPVAALDAYVTPPGARLRRLDVAGAFHTAAMAPAVFGLAGAITTVTPGQARSAVVANADGAVLHDGAEALGRLPGQLTGPVRFDLCLQALARLGVDRVLELAPGGTLAALVRRALPGVEVVALRGPADLDAARALVAADGSAEEQPDVGWRVLEATESGTVDLTAGAGAQVRLGDGLAVVRTRGGDVPVPAPRDGLLREWLVSDGDPVRAGQPLAVLA